MTPKKTKLTKAQLLEQTQQLNTLKNDPNCIFIPCNVPSSKNSKQWTGTHLVGSKTTQKYIRETKLLYKALMPKFIKMRIEAGLHEVRPLCVKIHLIRDSSRVFDFINIVQIIADLMTLNQWIKDDNLDEVYFIPLFVGGRAYTINKENAGLLLTI